MITLYIRYRGRGRPHGRGWDRRQIPSARALDALLSPTDSSYRRDLALAQLSLSLSALIPSNPPPERSSTITFRPSSSKPAAGSSTGGR